MAEFHVFKDTAAMTEAAARLFTDLAHRALSARGRFTVALPGGTTPVPLFQRLTFSPWREAIPWDRIVFFFGDERAVDADDEQSNFRTARVTLLDHVPVPAENVVRIRGELGAQGAAAALREDMVSAFGPDGTPRIDLIILGMGLDGHTASLYPGHKALGAQDWVVPVTDHTGSPGVDRVTLTLPVLCAARTVLFLATGPAKAGLIAELATDPAAGERYPAAMVEAESTLWYVDKAAYGKVAKR